MRPVDAAELEELVLAVGAADVDAVAISLLFSFANPRNESEVAQALEKLGLPLSVSHKILPEFREYERGSTVVANAYLAPKMGAYLTRLAKGVGGALQGGSAGGDAVFGWDHSGEAGCG